MAKPNQKQKVKINKKNEWLVPLALISITIIVFIPILWHEFVAWDDDMLIHQNPFYHPFNLHSFLYFWGHHYEGLYMPLTYNLWGIISLIAKLPPAPDRPSMSPTPFHAFNLLLHLINVLLVLNIILFLIKKYIPAPEKKTILGIPHELWAGGIGALVFAIHPVQVEPVAWATGAKELLSTFFSLAALRMYLGAAAGQTNGGKRGYFPGMLYFIVAMLAKPSAVAVPLITWFLDYLILKRSIKQSTSNVLPWIALAIPFIIIGKKIQPDIQVSFVPQLWQRPFVAGDAIAFYLYKLFFPFCLGPDYGRTPAYVLENWWGYATWIAPCLITVIAWTQRNKAPWFVAICVTVAGLLPVLGFVPFVYQSYSTVADRYLYLPMLGPALAVAWLALRLKGNLSKSVLVLALGVLTTLAFSQQNHWRNTMSLFEHALSVNPRSYIACNNMAVVYISKGEIDKAAEYLGRALEVRPEDAEANNNMGFLLANQGKLDEATEFYQRAIKAKPNYSSAYVNLGNIYVSKGDFQKAIEYYRKAISFNPYDAAGHGNLGYALYRLGKTEEAIKEYRLAIRLRPGFIEAHANLGDAFMAQGKIENAIEEYKEAVRLRPDFERACIGLGIALSRLGKFDEAADIFSQAIKANPESVEAHYGLANALFRLKRYDEAIAEYSKAAHLKPNFGGAHRNMAVCLFLVGRYSDAWLEVQLARKYGAEPHPNFLKALSQKMQKP